MEKLNKKEKEKVDEILEDKSMVFSVIYYILDVLVFSIVFLTSINLIKQISDNNTQVVLLILLIIVLPRLIRSIGRPTLVYRDVRYN